MGSDESRLVFSAAPTSGQWLGRTCVFNAAACFTASIGADVPSGGLLEQFGRQLCANGSKIGGGNMIYDGSWSELNLRSRLDTWQWFSSVCFAAHVWGPPGSVLWVCVRGRVYFRFTEPLSPPPPTVRQVTSLMASKTERALNVDCDSGQYTAGGECCVECSPGEGVVKECGATQTVCAQCLDSE